jgi:hypothetical protein
MERIYLYLLLIFAGLIMLYFWNRSNFKPEPKKRTTVPEPIVEEPFEMETQKLHVFDQEMGAVFINTLDSLGYFCFTRADQLVELQAEMKKAYNQISILTTIFSEEEPFNSFCGRQFMCDGEDLFEIGGLVALLEEIKPTFDKLGIPLIWSDEYWSEDIRIHTIVLNGKQYDAFRGDPNDNRIWGWATKNFMVMINDQLAIHGSKERLYSLYGGGNEGILFLLTHAQYEFLKSEAGLVEIPVSVEKFWD